jgi:hypothetical protein
MSSSGMFAGFSFIARTTRMAVRPDTLSDHVHTGVTHEMVRLEKHKLKPL